MQPWRDESWVACERILGKISQKGSAVLIVPWMVMSRRGSVPVKENGPNSGKPVCDMSVVNVVKTKLAMMGPRTSV